MAAAQTGVTNTNIRTVGRLHVPQSPNFFDATRVAVKSNSAATRLSLFLTNANTDDFTVLVRQPGGYQLVANAVSTNASALKVSLPANVPYILKPKAPVRAVLSTTPVALGGAAGMNQAPSNRIELRLINDWRRFDTLSGSYTSVIEICFMAHQEDARPYLPLTVKLYPSDGVSLTERTLELQESGFRGCVETTAICQSRPTNQIEVKSDLGDAFLTITFQAEPFIYRILPQPVLWTALAFSLLGSIVRVARAQDLRRKWLKVGGELFVGMFGGLLLVAALWAGIGVGNIPVAVVGKLAGVAVVAGIGGYGGAAILEFLLGKLFPSATPSPSKP